MSPNPPFELAEFDERGEPIIVPHPFAARQAAAQTAYTTLFRSRKSVV